MVMYKLRKIGGRNKNYLSSGNINGITIPNKIAMFFEDTSFSIEKSGTSIILTSGASQIITKQQIEEYQYEDCHIIG